MRTALVLGGASCLWADLDLLDGWRPDIVVATNEAGTAYRPRIDHFATLHPEKLPGWRLARWQAGGNGDYVTWSRRSPELVDRVLTGWNQGSSGMFAIGVALECGAVRVMLAGVPMDTSGHFFNDAPWDGARHHRDAWEKRVDQMRGRVFSCSGWTRELLGGPDLLPLDIAA